MNIRILAIATLTAVSLGTAAQAQSTSTTNCYRNSHGTRQCDSTIETAKSSTTTRCIFAGGNNQCETDAPIEKQVVIPEVSIEHVQSRGKTINIIRGSTIKSPENQ